jgi:uncharacterized integral membrane protein
MTDGTTPSIQDEKWRPSGRQIGIAVVVLIVAIFAAVNFEKVPIDFLITTERVQLVFVIVLCALLGFLAGFLFARHLEKKD